MKPVSKIDQLSKLIIGVVFTGLGLWLGTTTQLKLRVLAACVALLGGAVIIFFALYEPALHHPSRARHAYHKTQMLSLLLALAGLGFIGAHAYGLMASKPTAKANKVYKYAYMAQSCSDGVAKYRQMRQQIMDESTKVVNDATQESQRITAQAQSYDQTQDTNYKSALNDIYNAYEQGLISYDEYSRRVDALGQLPAYANVSNTVAAITTQQALDAAKQKVDANSKVLATVNDYVTRLESCISTARQTHDFTSSEVAELQTIIDNSTVRPE